jgi:hypothetical protein
MATNQYAKQANDAALQSRMKQYRDFGKVTREPLRALVMGIKESCPIDASISDAAARFQQRYKELTKKAEAPPADERYLKRAGNYRKATCNLEARSKRMEKAPELEAARVAGEEERNNWRLTHPKRAKATGSGARAKQRSQQREKKQEKKDQLRQEVERELEQHFPQGIVILDWIYASALARAKEKNKDAPADRPLVHVHEAMWEFLEENAEEAKTRIAQASATPDAQFTQEENDRLRAQGVPSAELAAPGVAASKRGAAASNRAGARKGGRPRGSATKAAPKSASAAPKGKRTPKSKRARAPKSKRAAGPKSASATAVPAGAGEPARASPCTCGPPEDKETAGGSPGTTRSRRSGPRSRAGAAQPPVSVVSAEGPDLESMGAVRISALRNQALNDERVRWLEETSASKSAIRMFQLPDGTEVLALGESAVGVALPSQRVLWAENVGTDKRFSSPLAVARDLLAEAGDVAAPTSAVPFTVSGLSVPSRSVEA